MLNVGEELAVDAKTGESTVMVGVDHVRAPGLVRLDLCDVTAFLAPGPARLMGEALIRYAAAIAGKEDPP